MKTSPKHSIGLAVTTLLCATALQAETPATQPAPAATTVHGEYKDWRMLGVSHRLDKNTVRAILANDVAIAAARAGKTKPWPDGTILAKLAWKEKIHPDWPQAVVPGEFVIADAMVKDGQKYSDTGGWGFGHWEGDKLVMNDKAKSAACFACHTPMKNNDYVYTFPALQ
ncbi:MAG: cytochrome P460 family protein [Gammaproteobacteria bacterium]